MNNCALILEGGALRSVYSAGVLDSFLQYNIEFPYVLGISAGALTAGNYISKQHGRSVVANIDYVDDPRYIGLKHLLKEGSIFNFDFLLGEPSKEWMEYDVNTFLESKQKYIIGATNCFSSETEFFEPKTYEQLATMVTASSTLPILSKIAYINDIPYIDGGIGEPIPYQKAVEDGYEKIVIVLTREFGYIEKRNNLFLNFLFKVYFRQYPSLVNKLVTLNERYNKKLRELDELERKKKVLILRPSVPPIVTRVEKNKKKLQDLYELGLSDTKKNISSIINYINQ